MTVIENQIYEGERPLFFKKDLKLEHIKVLNATTIHLIRQMMNKKSRKKLWLKPG